MSQSAKLVTELAAGEAPVYGVNTGFGDLATVRIPLGEQRALQRNLIRSHAAGVGDPLPVDVVRAVLLLRANTLAAGRSGVRPELAEMLLEMLDRGVHPVIPMHGSVGASGDLAPLAHAALVLIGEGEAFVEDTRMSGADPLELGPKEGVALINGTQVMTAIGCLAMHDAAVLAATADIVGAMSAEALRATDTAWNADLNRNVRVDASVAKMFGTEAAYKVLDRCIQIHGALGLSDELPLERWFRDLRVKRLGEGATEVQREVIARSLLR